MPLDGTIYGRGGTTPAWVPALPLTGGAMSGAITLAGNATQPLQAVPLQQLNSAVAGGPFLPLSGGTVASHITSTTAADSTLFVNMTNRGSGTNGPAGAQFGQKIYAYKDNWLTTSVVGEIDALQIVARQGGPGSDCGAIVADVQNTGTGFLAGHEYSVAVINPSTSAATQWIDSQEAALNGPGGAYYGHVYTALAGTLTAGILIQTQGTGVSWTNFFEAVQPSGNITIDGTGAVNTTGSLLTHSYLNVLGATATPAAGAFLMWNKSGGDGGLWLLNQKGGGAGGFHIGEVTTGGVVTDRLTIDGNGAVTIPGDVSLTGPAGTALYVQNDTTLAGTLYVAGTGTFAGPGTALQVSNNFNAGSIGVSTTLFVGGQGTFAATGVGLQVSNNMTVGGAFAVTGNAAVGSLGVTGAATLASTTQTGSQSLPLPAAKTGTAYTVAATDCSLVLTPTGTFTLTLPAASSSAGRIIRLKSTAAFAVNSASANIVQLVGGAATAAIMTATAGKTCMLQSDGTNWQLMQAN